MRHESQVGEMKGVRKLLKAWAKATAKNAGLKKGRLAEGFKVVITS